LHNYGDGQVQNLQYGPQIGDSGQLIEKMEIKGSVLENSLSLCLSLSLSQADWSFCPSDLQLIE
jgi:hypothetical protein